MSVEAYGHENILDVDLIQGGMGIGVSWYKLAGAVASEGKKCMGVVSGTVIGPLIARRLQDGDTNGDIRKALDKFPIPRISELIIERYYSEKGRCENEPYKTVPMFNADSSGIALILNMVGAFAEVWLAKHIASERSDSPGPVAMNLLTDLKNTTLSALYGAMLANVDCIIMGAGIPRNIPDALAKLALGQDVKIDLNVPESDQKFYVEFNPSQYRPSDGNIKLKKPDFLAIVSSDTLAKYLSRLDFPPSGFVIEGPVAGGHNAPPRKGMNYTEIDQVDLNKINELGMPYWLAGKKDYPGVIADAKKMGAQGIQVGTAFAMCRDSGIDPAIKSKIIDQVVSGSVEVTTSFNASPTGYPFKIVEQKDTLSENTVYEERKRVCDLGFLRKPYLSKDGKKLIYRCPAEPVEDYVKKGGDEADTVGKKCLCNGLLSTIGFGQSRKDGTTEKPIITAGDTLQEVVSNLVEIYGKEYTAKNVVEYLRVNADPATN